MSKSKMNTEASFAGKIGVTANESQPDKPTIQYPPQGAPNVVVVMLDDVGFGASSAFGGLVALCPRRQTGLLLQLDGSRDVQS
ncbi:MAG TPA: hypothetical protein VE715_22605 [Blastocatellia bacterium]|nr:hypothetical protein [Blastocatellia bacterium]